MDEPAENFLQRWSRRKNLARTPVRKAGETPVQVDARPGPTPGTAPGEAAGPAFDLASLPPVESITAASDVRAFLAPGVPGEIARAALRRAWVTDPAIRDFVGLAENQWDFTKPDGVPGFGVLDLTPELRRMVADLFCRTLAETEPAPAEAVQAIGSPAEATSALTPATSDSPRDKLNEMPTHATPIQMRAQAAAGAADPALQRGTGPADGRPTSSRRRHGRALPE
jgi:hypothetical protein